MKRHLIKRAALSELQAAIDRHIGIIGVTRTHCFTNNTAKDKFLYTMAIPMFYSAWEGFFRISIAICLRRLCLAKKRIDSYSKEYITLWLQREAFVGNFYKSLMVSIDLRVAQKPVNKARFDALTEFHDSIRDWLDKPFNLATNFDKLVMTYSNVNGDIAKLNAQVIGLDVSTVNFDPLNELLNRRNDIAHGGLINLVDEIDCLRIAQNAETLLQEFGQATKAWLAAN